MYNCQVTVALTILALIATVTAVSAVAPRLGLPAPLLLVIIGIAVSFLPFIDPIPLSPELVLIGLLPPLLYAAAIRTSLVDIKAFRRSIGLLAVGLVLFTTAARRVRRVLAAARSRWPRRSHSARSSRRRTPSRPPPSPAGSACRAAS